MRRLLATVALIVSVTSSHAGDAMMEKGIAGVIFYTAQCNADEIDDQTLTMTKIYFDNHRAAIEAQIKGIWKDITIPGLDKKTAVQMWCSLMRPTVLKTFSRR